MSDLVAMARIGLAFAMGMMLVCIEAAAQGRASEVNLPAMKPGAPPDDFKFERTGQGTPGQWIVVSEPTAAHGIAIAQVSQDRADYRFPLAIYQPVSHRNVDVVVRFKPVGGSVDQAGGIAVRLASPDDYYIARANALEDNLRFYRVVKGRREQLEGVNVKVASNQWHTLGLRAEGDRFTVSFDGKPLFTAEDKTFATPGKIALRTKADSVTHFDAISLTPLECPAVPVVSYGEQNDS
jgi:hypothetical protein